MKLDGKKLASLLLEGVKKESDRLKEKNISPTLAILQAGNDSSSDSYIKQKMKKSLDAGVEIKLIKMSEETPAEILVETVRKLNFDSDIHGIIIQRPVFDQLKSAEIYYSIGEDKDVDGFLPESKFEPPVALAVFRLLEETGVELENKKITVVGKGETAGGPIIKEFKKKNIRVFVADSKTDLTDALPQSDIVISAVGKKIINGNLLKKGVMLIGVGLFKGEDGKITGDYDEGEIEEIASFYTPTPGGVGPLNVAYLLKNVVEAAKLVKV